MWRWLWGLSGPTEENDLEKMKQRTLNEILDQNPLNQKNNPKNPDQNNTNNNTAPTTEKIFQPQVHILPTPAYSKLLELENQVSQTWQQIGELSRHSILYDPLAQGLDDQAKETQRLWKQLDELKQKKSQDQIRLKAQRESLERQKRYEQQLEEERMEREKKQKEEAEWNKVVEEQRKLLEAFSKKQKVEDHKK